MQNILLLKNREEYDNAPKCELGKKIMALYEDNSLQYNLNDKGNYFTATYNVTSTTYNTQLLGDNFDLTQITSMKIDDVTINTPITKCKFNTIGEHKIKCSFCQLNEEDKYILTLTSCENMFSGCRRLTSLDLSSFDTSNVTSMYNMFNVCDSLASIEFGGNFDTSNVTNMRRMFCGCTNLTSLDLSNFNTSAVTDMSEMFGYSTKTYSANSYYYDACYYLTSITFSDNFDTSNVTNMS